MISITTICAVLSNTKVMPFAGKVVLITGSSSGIGAVTALHFSKLGANVVVTGRDVLRTRRVAQQCRAIATQNAEVIDVIADLTKDSDVRRLIRTTIDEFGKINVLVNNANVSGISSIEDPKSPYIFDHIMQINVRAVFLLSQLSIPYLEVTKGNIINVSSRAATNPIQDYSLYCMSKSCLDMFTKCLAIDLKAKGIRVNSVNPAWLRPNICGRIGLTDDQIESGQMLHYPLKRLGEPEEIARTIEFLASNKACHITGVTTSIDGETVFAPYALSTIGH